MRYASSAMLRTMQMEEAVAMKTVKMVFSVGREMKQSTRLGHGHWSHCTSRGIWKPSYTTYRAYLGTKRHAPCAYAKLGPWRTERKTESQGLHESTFKQQPDHQAEEVRPPEGASYRQPLLLQRLQLFLLTLVAVESSSARTLLYRR